MVYENSHKHHLQVELETIFQGVLCTSYKGPPKQEDNEHSAEEGVARRYQQRDMVVYLRRRLVSSILVH